MILKKKNFKLMINFVCGKTMENLRKRINVTLVNKAEDFWKYTSKPKYITHNIFGKAYAAIHESKPVLILNKPIYVGFKKIFNAELLLTDTDSLTYEIKSKMLMNNFLSGKICLTLVIIQNIHSFLTRPIETLLVKWKINLVELL